MRFSYVKYDEKATKASETFKSQFELLEQMAGDLLEPGREASLVLTKLEEAFMWVGKSIRNSQIKRNAAASAHVTERTNE